MTYEDESRITRQKVPTDEDVSRFEALVRDHEKIVYTLALRTLGNKQDAMDATQEAFLRAWRGLPSFRGECKFSTWLYRLTANVCTDMLRKRSRTPEVSLTEEEDAVSDIPDRRFCPQTELEKKQFRLAVRRGLEKLPDEFRSVLLFRELGGLSYDEIARATGLEPGTVKTRIYRARKKLAAILMRDGNFSELSSSFTSAEQNRNGKGGADA